MAARSETADRPRKLSFQPVMTFAKQGLVLGHAVLAPLQKERKGTPAIAIDGAEERIQALLAVAYGQRVQPGVLGRIRWAARYWHRGEQELAAIEIALTGLPPLVHKEQAAARLCLGETLLAEGLGPRELIELCGLDPALLDIQKADYNPDQPRVPAGSPDGGQWTTAGEGGSPDPTGGTPVPGVSPIDPKVEFAGYTPVHGLPTDAVVVTTPHGRTIPDPNSKTKKLMAPPRADYRKVYAAGEAIASLPLVDQYSPARSAIAQGGQFDFQREPLTHKSYQAYVPAANYAVGVYMSGAGYSLSSTLVFAKLYALRYSSNYDAQDQLGWIQRGWQDGKSGVWK